VADYPTFDEFKRDLDSGAVYRPAASFEAEKASASAAADSIRGNLPLTERMNEIAGSLSIQMEAMNRYMQESIDISQRQLDFMEKQAETIGRMNTLQQTGNKYRREGATIEEKSYLQRVREHEQLEAFNDAQRMRNDLEKAGGQELVKQLRTYKMIDEQTGKVRVSRINEQGEREFESVSVVEMQKAANRRRRGQQIDPIQEQRLDRLLHDVQQESQLRGRSEDQASAAGLKAIIGAAASGNVFGALAMLATQRPTPAGMKALGSTLAIRGELMRGGALTTGMGRMAGSALTGLAPVARIIPPAGALIAAQQAYSFGTGQYRESTQIGRTTGEGFLAGTGARLNALWRGARNPFDLISADLALQIQRAIREQGIGGDSADAMTDAVADIVNDLGIDFKEATDAAVFAVREGNMTLAEFRDTMEDLDDVAKETGMSVQAVSRNVTQFRQMVTTAGGAAAGQAAGQQMTGLQQIFGQAGLQGFAQRPEFPQEAFQLQQAMALFGGAAPWNVSAKASIQQMTKQFDELMDFVRNMRPQGMPMEEFARFLQMMAPQGHPMLAFFANMTVPQILTLLRFSAGEGGNRIANMEAQQQREARLRAADKLRGVAEQAGGYRSFHKSWKARIAPGLQDIMGWDDERSPEEKVADPRQYGQAIRRQLQAQGVSQARINEIMAPAASAIRRGDRDAWERAIGGVVENAQRELRVTVGFTPDARGVLDSTTGSLEVARGNRRPQGNKQLSRVSRYSQ
jgi:hypothetical protein